MVWSSLATVGDSLPRGTTLDDDAFTRRHRSLRRLLAAHVPLLVAFGFLEGQAFAATGASATLAVLAWVSGRIASRRAAAVAVAVGLVLASVTLVLLAGGAVEARFHVFVVLGVVALYQDWLPFLTTVVVALAAQAAGTALAPGLVISHASGQQRPWLWAGIHAAALLAAAVGQVLLWRLTDDQHRRGTRLAADLARAQSQIEARESVSELLVNLARRNQALLDRQIDLIVGMEEHEADPDVLAQLFQLDHLATRVRRNAESLLVLSGEEPARRWGRPVPLTDVVRAAVAEVEDYRRVDVAVDELVAVAGRAVADVAHLLAELIENGLQFSPPESRVRVTSVLRADRSCVLRVEDRGIGLTELDRSSANDLLARPPEVDLRLSKRLGFHVVSRLAARYGVAVQLQATAGGGVTATVTVPEELLAPAEVPPVVPASAVAPVLIHPTRSSQPTPVVPTVAGRRLAPVPEPAVANWTASSVVRGRVVEPVTTSGSLPRRVPQSPPSPQLVAAPGSAPLVNRRSPEEVRSMLSRFQAGQNRGRNETRQHASEGDPG